MRIYLDHNATTPLRDEVVAAMLPVLREGFGNPSSTHAEGESARRAVDAAREQVAASLGVYPDEIKFCAGATEANNTVLRGVFDSGVEGRQLVISTVEHPSILAPAERLEGLGLRVARLAVDSEGLIDPAELAAALSEQTALVSIIWANNETGVVQPMQEISRVVRAHGAWLHVDATQALGKWRLNLDAVGVHSLACSAHKLNGPKGVGCLVVRRGRELPGLILGGGQELGGRGGTENVAGIVGFGVACELASRELPERIRRYAELRDRLWRGIQKAVPRVRRNGAADRVLPNTLSVEIIDCPGDVLLQALDLEGVAVSVGAACHSGSISPSHVLAAMGRSPQAALSSLRFSVGHGVHEAQLDRVVELLSVLVARVRGASAA